MAETDPSSNPVSDGDPALADKPAIDVPEGTAPNAEEVGAAAVAEQEAARAAPPAEPPPSDVMAQAEPDSEPLLPAETIEKIAKLDDEVAEAKASEKESAVAQFLAEEKKIEELTKALEAGNFNAAPTELSEGGHWIEDERQKDCPGSDPRCTP